MGTMSSRFSLQLYFQMNQRRRLSSRSGNNGVHGLNAFFLRTGSIIAQEGYWASLDWSFILDDKELRDLIRQTRPLI